MPPDGSKTASSFKPSSLNRTTNFQESPFSHHGYQGQTAVSFQMNEVSGQMLGNLDQLAPD